MTSHKQFIRPLAGFLATSAAAFLLSGTALAENVSVKLTGEQEVPPVTTSASGSGTITINDDKSVSGGVTTTGINAVAAHIHNGAPGKSGPVVVPMGKDGDNKWTV